MEILWFKVNGKGGESSYDAALGERLSLSWKCEGVTSCIIYPYNWEVDMEGSMDLYVYETMTLILRGFKGKESVQKQILVEVKGGERLNGISAEPSAPTAADTETVLSFNLQKTNFGYLDHGIGRIEGSSCRQVLSHQYGIYRYDILSANRETEFKEKTVKAGRSDAAELQKLKYVMMKNGNLQQYELSWRVVNNDGKDVIIETSDHKGTYTESASGHISFSRTGGEAVRLSIRCDAGEKGKIEFADIYPFELK